MRDAAEVVGITPGQVESIASFYTLLFKEPVGKHIIQVCRTMSCMLRGAEDLQDHIKRRLGIGNLETSADGQFTYEEVECLAACDRAPCLQHNLEFHYDVTAPSVRRAARHLERATAATGDAGGMTMATFEPVLTKGIGAAGPDRHRRVRARRRIRRPQEGAARR